MRRRLGFAVVLLVATAGLAACGGGDDDDGDASEPPTTERATGDATDDSTSGSESSEDLADLLERQDDAVVEITYRRGDDEFTIAQDHEKRAIRSGDTLVITTADTAINCTAVDTDPTCLDVPTGVNSLVNLGLSFYNVVAQGLAAAADRAPGLETTQDEVAGREATCADADANEILSDLTQGLGDVELPSTSARVCVDNETGFLLEFSTDGDPSDNLVAVEVGEPSDEDFEPPVPPTEIPGADLPPDEAPGDEPS
jgi:hypothetical protein